VWIQTLSWDRGPVLFYLPCGNERKNRYRRRLILLCYRLPISINSNQQFLSIDNDWINPDIDFYRLATLGDNSLCGSVSLRFNYSSSFWIHIPFNFFRFSPLFLRKTTVLLLKAPHHNFKFFLPEINSFAFSLKLTGTSLQLLRPNEG